LVNCKKPLKFSDALRQGTPLQIYLPNRYKPLQVTPRPIAEAFLVATDHGEALVWLDPYWCDPERNDACHVAYAKPQVKRSGNCWVDHKPRFGPHCLAYLNPVVVERIDWASHIGHAFKLWQAWCADKDARCGRTAAWRRVKRELADLNPRQLA
jgi:hypothetical protein